MVYKYIFTIVWSTWDHVETNIYKCGPTISLVASRDKEYIYATYSTHHSIPVMCRQNIVYTSTLYKSTSERKKCVPNSGWVSGIEPSPLEGNYATYA